MQDLKNTLDISMLENRIRCCGEPFTQDLRFYSLALSIPGARKRRNKPDEITLVKSCVSLGRFLKLARKHARTISMTDEVKRIEDGIFGFKESKKFRNAKNQIEGTPIAFKYCRHNPRPYQANGVLFADSFQDSSYLAFDMGTGKTITAIAFSIHRGYKRNLIVCPKGVIEVWGEEFRDCFSDFMKQARVVALSKGTGIQKAEVLQTMLSMATFSDQPIYIIVNYESALTGPVRDVLESVSWDLIVADEAHKLKSAKSKTSKMFAALGLKSKYRLCLSGTPIPNDKRDVFGQMRFLDPGIFGTNYSAFQARYAMMGGYGGYQVVGWQNEEEFDRLVKAKMFRVDINDVINLPEPIEKYVYSEMSKDAKRIYKELASEFALYLGSAEVSTTNTLSRLMKFRQLASGFIKTDEGEEIDIDNNKIFILEDLLEEISADEKLVIFCTFKKDISKITDAVANSGRGHPGEVSGDRKDTLGGKFPDWTNTLVCQLQAGGIGLNLQEARYCIFYDLSYSLSDYQQARARLYRSGQKHPVVFTHIVCNNGIDREIYRALINKKEAIDEVLKYIKGETVINEKGEK